MSREAADLIPPVSKRAPVTSSWRCHRPLEALKERALMIASAHSNFAAVSRRMPCINPRGGKPAPFCVPWPGGRHPFYELTV